MNKEGFFENFHTAWQWLYNHPMFKDKDGFERFNQCLCIDVVKVNPLTDAVALDHSLNTKTSIWLECGSWDDVLEEGLHDYMLDCGGDTFEIAIIRLANNVSEKWNEGCIE